MLRQAEPSAAGWLLLPAQCLLKVATGLEFRVGRIVVAYAELTPLITSSCMCLQQPVLAHGIGSHGGEAPGLGSNGDIVANGAQANPRANPVCACMYMHQQLSLCTTLSSFRGLCLCYSRAVIDRARVTSEHSASCYV
jgi:hypothetical protein